jgi:hypothetical protein
VQQEQATTADEPRRASGRRGKITSGTRTRPPEKIAADAARREAMLRAAAATPLPDAGYVGPEALCARLGPISVGTLNAWIRSGKVPPPTWLSARIRVWPVVQVRTLLERLGGTPRTEVADHA